MTIFNGGLIAGAALLGFLDLYFEWHILFVIFVGFILIAFGILKFINIRNHRKQIEVLENNYIYSNHSINENVDVTEYR
jgi:MFS family permease